ncbi:MULTISPECIES: hypothetical protein [Paenibacillus]|jgi:hypothetical protein|uniref:hypothetical protein n=1 Tax=Paenibacillus TaxID=44249 RepID=UPI0004B1B2EC|nr:MULTISPECIES: hypothetical protein [Paenibacillus]
MMETTNKMARNEPRVDGTWEITVPHEEDWLVEDIEQARTEYITKPSMAGVKDV